MNKHTPGPWKIRRLGKSQKIVELGPVCADEYAGSCWLDVSESDASLIAAAPDLLEALEDLYLLIEKNKENLPISFAFFLGKAYSAFSKARGAE